MSVTFTPSRLGEDGSRARPATGSVIDNSYIDKQALISKDASNLLKLGSDGALAVSAADVPSGGTAAVDPASLVSAKAGNQLTVSTDKKLYVPAPATVSASDLVSSDTGNSLTMGTDARLFVKTPETASAGALRSADADNLLKLGTDARLTLTSGAIISDAPAVNLLTTNAADHALQVLPDDVKKNLSVVSADKGNALSAGTDGGAFLDPLSVKTSVTAGAGVSVTGSTISVAYGDGLAVDQTTNRLHVDKDALNIKDISLLASEKILSLTDAGVLSATASITYDATKSTLSLFGVNNALLSTVSLPGATSALKAVELVENPTGYEAGSYFKYTFLTSTSDLNYVYVKVPATSAIAAGNGVSAVTSKDVTTVSVLPRPAGGLETDGTGVAVKLKTDGGLAMDADGVYVRKQPADIVAGTGIAVQTAGTTTTVSAKLKADGGLASDDNGLYVTAKAAELTEGAGIKLTVTGTATQVATRLKAKGGIASGDDGLFADTAVVASKASVDAIIDGTTGVTLKTLQDALTGGSLFVSSTAIDHDAMASGTSGLEPAVNLL